MNISVVEVQTKTITLRPPRDGETRKSAKSFTFDSCFESKASADKSADRASSGQVEVFAAVGQDLLDNAFQGIYSTIQLIYIKNVY